MGIISMFFKLINNYITILSNAVKSVFYRKFVAWSDYVLSDISSRFVEQKFANGQKTIKKDPTKKCLDNNFI